ncbi:hypothetical protein ACHQM5_022946 [Ranunculus cassubicifolius]
MVLDDFDDLLDDAPSKPARRPSRFQPKSAKIKPKPEPNVDFTHPKQEDVQVIQPQQCSVDIKPNETDRISETKPDETMEDVEAVEEDTNVEPMEEDIEEEEDSVVREIDVYFSPPPLDSNAQLYVLQYPLRPSWRPYELDERCKEVRIHPKTGNVEVELSLDTSSNYDQDIADHLRIEKQILSSWRPPLTTSYAVGILKGNELHLNPVHAVVQLRPSMEHLTSGRSKKSSAAQQVENTTKKQGKTVESTSESGTDTEEPWISLDYHGKINGESSLSTRYQEKMTSQVRSDIPFSMSPYEYINSLCPGSNTANDGSRGQLRRSLLSLPLKERFERWFTEGPQVNRFSTLKHLAPDHSDEDVINILQICACLVQGLWIARTSLLKLKRAEGIARDYLLLLFKNNDVVNRQQLDEYNLYKEAEPYLKEFAVQKPSKKDWTMKEPRDTSFISGYPHIVEDQKKKLDHMHNLVLSALQKTKNAAAGKKVPPKNPPVTTDQAANLPVHGTSGPRPTTIPDLPKSIEALLRKHNVCSLQFICQSLQEQGILNADNAPPLPELHSVLGQIAIKIRDVYVLKSLGESDLDPLRSVVINLLGAKEPNAKLRKAEIDAAASIAMKGTIISKDVYTRVMNQLCYTVKGSGWVLKAGDGHSKLNSLDLPDASNNS